MKGFIVFNNKSGNLYYNKYYQADAKLSKDTDFFNKSLDKQDPMHIAMQFLTLLKMADVCVDEYENDYPGQMEADVNARNAFKQGFRSFKSDSVDYLLEHHDDYPLTLVLFYDSGSQDEAITRILACKLLDIFIVKHERKLKKVGSNHMASISTKQTTLEFEASLPVIYENVST